MESVLYQCKGLTKKNTQCKIMLIAPDEKNCYCKRHCKLFTNEQLTTFNEFRNKIISSKKSLNKKKEKSENKEENKEECKEECKKEYKVEYKLEKPEECPVCMDSLEDQKEPLEPCGHWVHRDCQVKSGLTCVICRTEIKYTPKELQLINRTIRKRKRDEEKENFRAAQEIDNFTNRDRIVNNLNNYNNIPRPRMRFAIYDDNLEIFQIAHLAAMELATNEGREGNPTSIANNLHMITQAILNRRNPWYRLTRVTIDEVLRDGVLPSIM
jgi:hypothetical protein